VWTKRQHDFASSSLPAREQSTYGYMSLVTGFLDSLWQRTGTSRYCRFAKRWRGYLSRVSREPLWPLPPARECGCWPLAVGTSGTDSIS
jgi:hypothetical protein